MVIISCLYNHRLKTRRQLIDCLNQRQQIEVVHYGTVKLRRNL